MSDARPFIDPETGSLDTDRILAEVYPLTGLVALFAGVALVPYLVALFVGRSPFGVVFTILAQFVLAIGAGIVLMYVVARGIQLAED
jgi:hypothetical protein